MMKCNNTINTVDKYQTDIQDQFSIIQNVFVETPLMKKLTWMSQSWLTFYNNWLQKSTEYEYLINVLQA